MRANVKAKIFAKLAERAQQRRALENAKKEAQREREMIAEVHRRIEALRRQRRLNAEHNRRAHEHAQFSAFGRVVPGLQMPSRHNLRHY